jgi:hypothetical protein
MMMRRRGPGLIRTAARTTVIAGTATAVSGNVMRRQQRKAYEEQARMEAQAQPAAPAPPEAAAAPPPEQPAYVAELEKLAQLKAQGVITEEDFEVKKRQLLGI